MRIYDLVHVFIKSQVLPQQNIYAIESIYLFIHVKILCGLCEL